MKQLVYAMIILLAILHQDFWWWDNSETLWFGFMPVGLGYHALVSLAAGVLWALAIKHCWPAGVDRIEEAVSPATDSSEGAK